MHMLLEVESLHHLVVNGNRPPAASQLQAQLAAALPVTVRVAGTTDSGALLRKALDGLQSFSTAPTKFNYEVRFGRAAAGGMGGRATGDHSLGHPEGQSMHVWGDGDRDWEILHCVVSAAPTNFNY